MLLLRKGLALGVIAVTVLVLAHEYGGQSEPSPPAFAPEVRLQRTAVTVSNPSFMDWTDVLVTIDRTYRCTAPADLPGGRVLTIPLSDCGGFDVSTQRVREVDLRARVDGQLLFKTLRP